MSNVVKILSRMKYLVRTQLLSILNSIITALKSVALILILFALVTRCYSWFGGDIGGLEIFYENFENSVDKDEI